jgi:hypothetical protein
MGWTGMYREPGQTNAEFFGKELRDGDKIIASNTEPGFNGTFYAAVQRPSGEVWALVVQQGRNGQEYLYKDMDETVGPNEVGASREVFDALTPTDSEWANQWRERVAIDLARRDEARARAKMAVPGTMVVFTRPVDLSHGDKFRVGKIVGKGRIQYFTDEDMRYPGFDEADTLRYGQYANLGRRWTNRMFTVVDSFAEALKRINELDAPAAAALEHRPSTAQGRVGRGIPAGGQFTGQHRPDADVSL